MMRRVGRAGLLILAATLLGRLSWSQDAPAPEAKPKNTVRPAIEWKRFDYICENDAMLTLYLHETTAKVKFKDQVYMMRQTPSADGNRYSDGKVVWWGKGGEGFLQEDTPDGNGRKLVKDCVLDKPGTRENTVTGTITYLARMALPPQATIVVELQDVSRADAPAAVIAQEKFSLGRNQVPVPFTLKYAGKIDEKHQYSVSARVMLGTELKFVTDQAYPVITQGNPSKVDLLLKPVKP